MKKALIRLEDVGPGGVYSENQNLIKLSIIGDYLQAKNIPYHISLIPRYVKPSVNWDKSISAKDDLYIKGFNNTIKYLSLYKGCTLGMHGYTHQYGLDESGVGYEFAYSACRENCPPNDTKIASSNKKAFNKSYTINRMKQGFKDYFQSGLEIAWGFSTPHYTASENQRALLESVCGLFFEDDPKSTDAYKTLSIRDTDMPFYRGVIYVPTPLGYINHNDKEKDIARICSELCDYTANDLAAFYFHPYLEFPYIHITPNGVIYDENSCLKRLVRCFKKQGFTFVSLLSLVDFVPSGRETNFFPGPRNRFFSGTLKDRDGTNLIIWQPDSGNWYWAFANLGRFPSRQSPWGTSASHLALTNWAVGALWKSMPGDFNGDGNTDIVAWDNLQGNWYVALSKGAHFIPDLGPGDYTWLKSWAIGSDWVPLIGDFNGDLKDDLAVWDPFKGDWYIALSSGKGFLPAKGNGDYTWLKAWGKGQHLVPLAGDFNGDGKDDIALWDPILGTLQVALSNGSVFTPTPGPNNPFWLQSWVSGHKWQLLVGDFNGDKIDDILAVSPDEGDWRIALSDKTQFKPTGNNLKPWAAAKGMEPLVGDFNGNGKSDILARHPLLRNGTIDIAESVLA